MFSPLGGRLGLCILSLASGQFADVDESLALNCLQHHVNLQPRQSSKESDHRFPRWPKRSERESQRRAARGPPIDEDLPLCGMTGPPDFMRLSLSDDMKSFHLDVTALHHTPQVEILVTAMSLNGAYSDEDGFSMTRAFPLEDSENALLQLQLSKDNQSVEIRKPPLGIRTTDQQSVQAVKEGLGDGWLSSLDRLQCASEDKDPIVIDGRKLIWEGFYTAADTADDALDFRILDAKSYRSNVDVSVEYVMGDRPPMKVGFSLVLLPKKMMTPRASDDRLLFFASEFQDLGYREAVAQEAPSHAVDRQSAMIWRYNLEVLPGREIRVHVDPSVPHRWREWFRKGIEAWNDAFSFHAHQVVKGIVPGDKDWPEDYDISDARFSTISWDLSDEVVSMGIAKVDPRSGEIIKSDITMASGWIKAWLEDLDDLAPGLTHQLVPTSSPRKNGLLQQGARLRAGLHGLRLERGERRRLGLVSRGGLNASHLEKLLGEGLKSIVMHETGHILGLRHNFKGSLGVSLQCLQDKACTAKSGLSASVMDYVPTNIPDADDPDKVHAFGPVIGAYDKLAIAFGYTPVKKEHWPRIAPELQNILKGAEAYEVCYDDNEAGEDPKCMAYDMSEEPITYFEKEVERYVLAQKRLLEMSVAPGEPYRLYGQAVSAMVSRTESIGLKLVRWLGGIEDHFLHRGEGSSKLRSARPIDRLQQQRALALVLRILRPFDTGLLPPEENLPFLVEGRWTDEVKSLDISSRVHSMTRKIIYRLLDAKRMLQIYRQQLLGHKEEALGIDDVLDELITTILDPGLTKVAAGHELRPQEMDLQLTLVSALKDLYMATSSTTHKTEPPTLREPISTKVMYFLQRAREKTLTTMETVPVVQAEDWRVCAMLGATCKCKNGLVRLAIGTDDAAMVVSSVKAVASQTFCAEDGFQVEVIQPVTGDVPMKRWCECIEPQASAQGQLRSHFKLLNREFAAVFCEDFETCQSPRVRLMQAEDSKAQESAKDEEHSFSNRYIWLIGGLILIPLACGVVLFTRRRQ